MKKSLVKFGLKLKRSLIVNSLLVAYTLIALAMAMQWIWYSNAEVTILRLGPFNPGEVIAIFSILHCGVPEHIVFFLLRQVRAPLRAMAYFACAESLPFNHVARDRLYRLALESLGFRV